MTDDDDRLWHEQFLPEEDLDDNVKNMLDTMRRQGAGTRRDLAAEGRESLQRSLSALLDDLGVLVQLGDRRAVRLYDAIMDVVTEGEHVPSRRARNRTVN